MRARLRSLEQLIPLATAGELVANKRRAVVSVSPDTTVRDALREMEAHDIGFDLMGSLIERHGRLPHKLQQERVTVFFPYSSSY